MGGKLLHAPHDDDDDDGGDEVVVVVVEMGLTISWLTPGVVVEVVEMGATISGSALEVDEMVAVVVDTEIDDDQTANNSCNLPPPALVNTVAVSRTDSEFHTRLIPRPSSGKKILDPPAHKDFASADHDHDHFGGGVGFGFAVAAAAAGGGHR